MKLVKHISDKPIIGINVLKCGIEFIDIIFGEHKLLEDFVTGVVLARDLLVALEGGARESTISHCSTERRCEDNGLANKIGAVVIYTLG